MYIVDFTYDGRTLSSLGCGVGSLSTSNNENPTLGSELTFDTWTNTASWKQGVVEAKFETPLEFTFDIVKMNCDDMNNYTFSPQEIADIMKWLNRKTYKKFSPVFNDGSYSDVYFMGTFTNITAIHMIGEVVGFTLTFTTNSPFGYVEHVSSGGEKPNLIPYPYADGMEREYDNTTFIVNPNDHSIKVSGQTWGADFSLISDTQEFYLNAEETYTIIPHNIPKPQYEPVYDKLKITYRYKDGRVYFSDYIDETTKIKVPYVDGAKTKVSLDIHIVQGYPDRFTDITFTPAIIKGEPGKKLSITDISDTFDGYIYPNKVTIKCNESGNLTLINSADTISTVINNCTSGETITMDCEHRVITSDMAHVNLYNDFNYNYPRIFCSQVNTFTQSIPCEVTIEYSSIRKVGIMA